VFSGIPLWDFSGNTGLCQLPPEVLRNAVRRFCKQMNICFLIKGSFNIVDPTKDSKIQAQNQFKKIVFSGLRNGFRIK
jgi:hypothetical protein